jgi:hypothetical protein
VARPNIHINDNGQITEREMTEKEYAALIESGWTETAPEETPTE